MSAVPAVKSDIRIAAFEAGEIDPAGFDHAAHVYVAWCYLQENGLIDAIARFTGALRALTKRLDIPGKYHETISWFFMLLIAERCAQSPGADWPTFRRRNVDLMRDSAALLRRYYSTERLQSALAREHFLLPDRGSGRL